MVPYVWSGTALRSWWAADERSKTSVVAHWSREASIRPRTDFSPCNSTRLFVDRVRSSSSVTLRRARCTVAGTLARLRSSVTAGMAPPKRPLTSEASPKVRELLLRLFRSVCVTPTPRYSDSLLLRYLARMQN
eukprot:scaffold41143_cov65-Phaeocystis_antarctica.AAC.2